MQRTLWIIQQLDGRKVWLWCICLLLLVHLINRLFQLLVLLPRLLRAEFLVLFHHILHAQLGCVVARVVVGAAPPEILLAYKELQSSNKNLL